MNETSVMCPDCSVPMETGFVRDSMSAASARQAAWFPGAPRFKGLLGMTTDNLILDKSAVVPIATYRCPDCFLLRQYAPK